MARAKAVSSLWASMVLSVTVCACTEPVDFSRDLGAEASTDGTVSALPLEASLEAGIESSACSSSAIVSQRCLPLGETCVSDGDCCTRVCRTGTCLSGAACAAPGAACNRRSDCCSGRCEPSNQGGGRVCTGYCRPDTSPCMGPHDCCSLACNGGLCGGPTCARIGEPCTSDPQCCEEHCDTQHNHVCDVPRRAQSCRPTGEACGGDAGVQCCSTACNFLTGRCDLGAIGPCREPSTPCMADTDCCSGGACVASTVPGGGLVCSATCGTDGQLCATDNDCCSHQCRGPLPSTCTPAAVSCDR